MTFSDMEAIDIGRWMIFISLLALYSGVHHAVVEPCIELLGVCISSSLLDFTAARQQLTLLLSAS
jgi:hypothetical protein